MVFAHKYPTILLHAHVLTVSLVSTVTSHLSQLQQSHQQQTLHQLQLSQQLLSIQSQLARPIYNSVSIKVHAHTTQSPMPSTAIVCQTLAAQLAPLKYHSVL